MNKRNIYQTVFLLLSFSLLTFSQENIEVNDFARLSKEISPQKTVKGLEQAVSDAKNIYKTNKKKFRNKQAALAKTTLNFALFRKHIFQVLNEKLTNSRLINGEGLKFLKLYESNANELEKLFEKFINIYEVSLKIEDSLLAKAKFEFADSLDSYKLLSKDANNRKKNIEKVERTQNLYLQAHGLWEKELDKNDETVLVSGFHLANSYLRTADFEKALPLYERYIEGVTEKFGSKSESLLPALQINAAIWNMIGHADEVEKLKKQILEIIKNDIELTVALLSISPRAKSLKYKGLNRISGGIFNSAPVGVIREGGTGQTRNSINTPINSRISGTVYTNIIGEAQSTFIRSKAVRTFITVDKEGRVIVARAETNDSKLKNKIEKEVKKWEFEPFAHEGKKVEMKGLVYYQVLVSKKLKF